MSKSGVITYKLAAHATDLAKGHPEPSIATTPRVEFRWKDQSRLSLDPVTAPKYHYATLSEDQIAYFCSIFSSRFRSMKITDDLRKYAAKQGDCGGGCGECRDGGEVERVCGEWRRSLCEELAADRLMRLV